MSTLMQQFEQTHRMELCMLCIFISLIVFGFITTALQEIYEQCYQQLQLAYSY